MSWKVIEEKYDISVTNGKFGMVIKGGTSEEALEIAAVIVNALNAQQYNGLPTDYEIEKHLNDPVLDDENYVYPFGGKDEEYTDGYYDGAQWMRSIAQQQIHQYREALQWFCERVEKEEVRSTKTYNKFKQLLDK